MGRKSHNSFKQLSHETRKPETKVGLKSYLIACEGECTEPNYINGLVKHQKLIQKIAIGTEVVIVPHGATDPYGVLNELLNVPDKDRFDEFWIVIDRDEVELKKKGYGGHTKENFNKAIDESSKNGVNVACSNPCFELWLVLHFEYRDTACTREEIQKKALEKVNSILPDKLKMQKVDDLKALESIYDLLKEKMPTARKYAEKLKENDIKHENPSSGMYKFLNSLIGDNG